MPFINPVPQRQRYSPGVGTVWAIGVGTTGGGDEATGEVAAELDGVTAPEAEGGVMTALLVVLAGALGVGCPTVTESVSRNTS